MLTVTLFIQFLNLNPTLLDSLSTLVPQDNANLSLRAFWTLFDLLWAVESAKVRAATDNHDPSNPSGPSQPTEEVSLRERVIQTLFQKRETPSPPNNPSLTCIFATLFDIHDTVILQLLQSYGGDLAVSAETLML